VHSARIAVRVRARRTPFLKSTLPLLTGMALTFAGVARDQRLYQLIRQSKDVAEHTFN